MKIKLFVDAHVFDGVHQGTTTYLKGLYTALVKNPNFEITLAANNVDYLKQNFPNEDFKLLKLRTTSKFKRLAIEIPKLLRKHKFDFAHFQYITPLKKECKYINTIHDLIFIDYPQYFPLNFKFKNGIAFKLSAKRSDVICTVSNYSAKALSKHYNYDLASITVTPNAVENFNGEFVDIKSKYNLDKYLLFVSRLEPRKNHILLLTCFVEMELYKQGYKLIFVGRIDDLKTKDYHTYYNQISPEIKKFISFYENVSANELASFYKNASLFVYPSIAEGFGIPPLEAAVLNCKVLCSNQTAMDDFDFFGEYLFNPFEKETLKLKIMKALNDTNYPFELIKEAILKRYNWEVIATHFAEKLITELNG